MSRNKKNLGKKFPAIAGSIAKLVSRMRSFDGEIVALDEQGRSSFQLLQGFVIGGYIDPDGARKHFGALLVGFYEGKRLKFNGRVDAGFREKLLRSLHSDLSKIEVETCPFFNASSSRSIALSSPTRGKKKRPASVLVLIPSKRRTGNE